jgi:hypothetical protein
LLSAAAVAALCLALGVRAADAQVGARNYPDTLVTQDPNPSSPNCDRLILNSLRA